LLETDFSDPLSTVGVGSCATVTAFKHPSLPLCAILAMTREGGLLFAADQRCFA